MGTKKRLNNRTTSRLWAIITPVVGLLSLAWFLIRVIPKPSRAMYPCQRVAFPVASGFVVWLISLFSSVVLFKKTKMLFKNRQIGLALLTMVLFIAMLSFTFIQSPSQPAFASVTADEHFEPTDAPNTPMGEAKGIHPGRVTWAYNEDATRWNGSGTWSSDTYTNQSIVNEMVSQSLTTLTEAANDAQAWDMLFRHFNKDHGNGDSGYQAGEKIAIKLNLNSSGTHGSNGNKFYSSPQGALAMLEQLVENAGVAPEDITFFDATRYVPKEIYEKCKNKYPSVNFADWEGGDGRAKVVRDLDARIPLSKELDMEDGGGNPVYVPTCVSQAKYLINMGQLKGHSLAGVTLNAKNMFGAVMSFPADDEPQSSAPWNAGFHPYICVHSDFHFGGHWDFNKRDMDTYNVLVDLLASKHLGAKTLLFFIDGLYSAPSQSEQLSRNHKWQSFGNDWPNSIFMSQDPIAIESVALDFLRNESVQTWVRGNVDNYLHEASMAHNPASGMLYDPDKNGVASQSLGVHEHWNNATDKQYSRNLGTGEGIELVKATTATDIATDEDPEILENFALLSNYPNPFNSQTVINYTLPARENVKLDIYTITGKHVATLTNSLKDAGEHKAVWAGIDDNGNDLSSGTYLVHLQAGSFVKSHRITLLK